MGQGSTFFTAPLQDSGILELKDFKGPILFIFSYFYLLPSHSNFVAKEKSFFFFIISLFTTCHKERIVLTSVEEKYVLLSIQGSSQRAKCCKHWSLATDVHMTQDPYNANKVISPSAKVVKSVIGIFFKKNLEFLFLLRIMLC